MLIFSGVHGAAQSVGHLSQLRLIAQRCTARLTLVCLDHQLSSGRSQPQVYQRAALL